MNTLITVAGEAVIHPDGTSLTERWTAFFYIALVLSLVLVLVVEFLAKGHKKRKTALISVLSAGVLALVGVVFFAYLHNASEGEYVAGDVAPVEQFIDGDLVKAEQSPGGARVSVLLPDSGYARYSLDSDNIEIYRLPDHEDDGQVLYSHVYRCWIDSLESEPTERCRETRKIELHISGDVLPGLELEESAARD